jgi:hypothetical protein
MNHTVQHEAHARPSTASQGVAQLCEDARKAIVRLADAANLPSSEVAERETAARVAVNHIESAVVNTIADVVTSVLRKHGIEVAVPAADVTPEYEGPSFVAPLDLHDNADDVRSAIDGLFRIIVELDTHVHPESSKRSRALFRSAQRKFVFGHSALAYVEDCVRTHNARAFGESFDDGAEEDTLSAAAEE